MRNPEVAKRYYTSMDTATCDERCRAFSNKWPTRKSPTCKRTKIRRLRSGGIRRDPETTCRVKQRNERPAVRKVTIERRFAQKNRGNPIPGLPSSVCSSPALPSVKAAPLPATTGSTPGRIPPAARGSTPQAPPSRPAPRPSIATRRVGQRTAGPSGESRSPPG